MKLRHFSVLVFLVFALHASAQGPDTPPGATTVVYNWKENVLKNDLPFDKPIYLVIDASGISPAPATVKLRLGKSLNSAGLQDIMTSPVFRNGNFYIMLSGSELGKLFKNKERLLLPAKDYAYEFTFFDATRKEVPNSKVLNGTATNTRLSNYIKMDFGFGYVPAIKGVIGFTSAHMYLTAINDDTDLADIKSFGRNIFLRTSFFFGLSPFTLTSDTEQPIAKLGGAGNFIYGVGIRSPFYGYLIKGRTPRAFLQPMRIHLGEMMFKQADANSLIDEEHVKKAFYIGLSLDLNIGKLFSPLAELYTP